jgi:hypothetical protein
MLTSPAKTVLVVKVIQITLVVLAIMLSPVASELKAMSVLSALLLLGVGAWLTVYALNCMVVGKCTTFAWVLASLVVFFFVVSVLASVVRVSSENRRIAEFYADAVPAFQTGTSDAPVPVQPPMSAAQQQQYNLQMANAQQNAFQQKLIRQAQAQPQS